jgi:hypothetical protein
MLFLLALPALAEAPAVDAPAVDAPAIEITSTRPVQVSRIEGIVSSPLCTAPCEVQLDAGSPTLSFTGDGVTPALHPLTLAAGDRVHLHVKAGPSGASTTGGVFGIVAVGTLVASTISFAAADTPAPGFALLGTSLVSGLVAFPLTKIGKTRVTATHD